jgi:hypothetical protein
VGDTAVRTVSRDDYAEHEAEWLAAGWRVHATAQSSNGDLVVAWYLPGASAESREQAAAQARNAAIRADRWRTRPATLLPMQEAMTAALRSRPEAPTPKPGPPRVRLDASAAPRSEVSLDAVPMVAGALSGRAVLAPLDDPGPSLAFADTRLRRSATVLEIEVPMPAYNAFLYLNFEKTDGSYLSLNFSDLLEGARATAQGEQGAMARARMPESCPRLTALLGDGTTTVEGWTLACFPMPMVDALGQSGAGELIVIGGGRPLGGRVTAADIEWAVGGGDAALRVSLEWARYLLAFGDELAARPDKVTVKEIAGYVEQGVGILKTAVDNARALSGG